MKIKKILGYIAVGAVCVGTGYLIGNAGAREKVCGGLKTIGGKLVATVKGNKKSGGECEGGDCGGSEPQANERPQQENRQNNNGGWRNKPRYNNNKNNN
jgi:hypothetical protein